MERSDLICKIIEIAGDYRKGEIGAFDAKHVEKWISQFELTRHDQNVILREMGHMLSNYYISREKGKDNLLRMFKCMKEERAGGCSTYDVNFLRTQAEGKSQHAMLLLADEILQADKGVTTANCGGSNVYFYLDDCAYSGNKWRYDIEKSTELAHAKEGFKLITYHWALYSGAYDYAQFYIKSCIAKKQGVFKPFRCDFLRNARFNGGKEKLDIFWPTYVKGNKYTEAFIKRSHALCAEKGWTVRPLFRTNDVMAPTMFTSPQNQHIVEQAFLTVGARLVCSAQNPARSMRPMGFEVLATVGYGTPIVTWRNIANNCPLALWYGDPRYGSNHPLGAWYPLFPRKV